MESLLFEWQVSQLIIWVIEWLTQWMFGFWFCIMNYLSSETEKKRWYLLCLLLQNKPPKTWIILKLMLQNCPFRILFQFHHSLCVKTCIHPSHTPHKNCLCNSFLSLVHTCGQNSRLSIKKFSTLSIDCRGTNPTWSRTFCHTSTPATCLWTIAEVCL